MRVRFKKSPHFLTLRRVRIFLLFLLLLAVEIGHLNLKSALILNRVLYFLRRAHLGKHFIHVCRLLLDYLLMLCLVKQAGASSVHPFIFLSLHHFQTGVVSVLDCILIIISLLLGGFHRLMPAPPWWF